MMMEPIKLNGQMRRAVRRSRLSQAAICRAAGVDQGLVCNFLAGRRRLSTADLTRLAGALDMEIVLRPKRKRKGN